MTLVLDRGGTSLDHVAIGVADTERGVAEIAQLIGFEPHLSEPEPGQFYWSGAVPLGSGRFLEILGPNPTFKKFNPFIELVKRLESPQPLFWYVATGDFATFQKAASSTGAPVERVQTVAFERDGVKMDYTRGYLGPGFMSASPNVIQWRARSDQWDSGEGPVLLGLELSHPEADRLNTVFARLGIDQMVRTGPHRMVLRLGTPNGEVEFAGDGMEMRGLGATVKMTDMFFRWLFTKRD
ncbi:MAG: VOC family protein [Pseudomonadota bacterium]